ncbi:hypothetical protein [Nocardia sp. NPDC049707]|uniref:hypothetical protein n=1 Tax=Nocardia sp. NPDC049707 TaxID=3154735 RepID=UPI00344A45F1
MNATQQVRDLLRIHDLRLVGRIGADHLFVDGCDICPKPAVMLTETITLEGRGATHEGGIYCLGHGTAAVDLLMWQVMDEITVTVPAELVASYGALAA